WPMRGLLVRVVMGLAAAGMLLSAAPRDAAAHCRAEGSTASHHGSPDAGHHHHGGKDIGSPTDCPHCPPADCRRHVQCASVTDPGSAGSPGLAPIPPAAATPHRDSIVRAGERVEPPI